MLGCLIIVSLAVAVFTQSVPCGVSTVQPAINRIVGGKEAVRGSWPWTVLMADAIGFIAGTGAIINPHVILTSAQHFKGPGYDVNSLDINQWRIYAGEHNVNTDDPNEKVYHISSVVVHPSYNDSTLLNDVALVFTSNPIVYNDHVRPACLPDSGHMYTVGEMCYLPGWGSTETTGNEEVLNQVAMPILADSVCSNHWDDFIAGTELCAGYENGGKDFCGDDIGSPLMCKDATTSAWYIQGLASSGGDCTKADEPGIFEDVSTYRAWITKTMAAAGYAYEY